MKKIISLVVTLALMLSSVSVTAQKEVSVIKDGQHIIFDVNPYIDVDTTMVPMRAIFESVGAKVTWDGETRTVISLYQVGDEYKTLTLQVGNNFLFLNGEKIPMSKAAVIVGDRTFVPLRAVIETLGHDVSWDPDTYTVKITTK